MMTFGFTTLIDVLSWVAALALGLEVVATSFVLIVNKEMRDRPGWGSALWGGHQDNPGHRRALPYLDCPVGRQDGSRLVLFCSGGVRYRGTTIENPATSKSHRQPIGG